MRSQLGERSSILTFTDVTPCVHSNPIKLSPIQFSDTNLPFIKLLPGVNICTAPVADYSHPSSTGTDVVVQPSSYRTRSSHLFALENILKIFCL